MKICGQCEFENEDDVKSCVQCGAELENEAGAEVSETEAKVSEAVEEAVNVTGTEEIPEVIDDAEATEVSEAGQDMADAADSDDEEAEVEENIETDADNVVETDIEQDVTEAAAGVAVGMDEQPEFIPTAERKPVPKGVKTGVLAAVIIVAAAVLFYFFGSLGVLAKVGIINSARYIGIVQDKMIQETEEAPAVRLEDAFNAFFEKEADAEPEAETAEEESGLMDKLKSLTGNSSENSSVSWMAQKTADGVVVKAETVCTFDMKENTVATYNVKLNFDGSISSEEFAASDKVLDSEQTLSVLQKIARYSDPEKTDYTTKDLSSSKYNNREFYYPSGITLEMLAGQNTAEFLTQYGISDDVEGTTDMTVLEKLILGEKYVEMMGVTFDEMKTQLGLDETITPDMTWGKIQDEIMIKNYGITEETIGEFKEYYGFGDEVTLDTKYKDIEPRMIKFQFDEMKRMQAEQEAAAAETPADSAQTGETPAEEVPVEEAPAEEVPAEAAQTQTEAEQTAE